MRRFLLIMVFSICWVASVFAQSIEMEPGLILSMTITNSSGNSYQTTAVPTTTIYPGRDHILGWSIIANDNTKNAEYVASFYDQTSTPITNASGECLGESEVSSNPASNTIWLPYPRTIDNGLLVWQGPNTAVTIYWKRG